MRQVHRQDNKNNHVEPFPINYLSNSKSEKYSGNSKIIIVFMDFRLQYKIDSRQKVATKEICYFHSKINFNILT